MNKRTSWSCVLSPSVACASSFLASQALTAVFSTKEPITTINSFLIEFRWDGPQSDDAAGTASNTPEAVYGVPQRAPMVPRAGGSSDRSNRFLARASVRSSPASHKRVGAGGTNERLGGHEYRAEGGLPSASLGAAESRTALETSAASLAVEDNEGQQIFRNPGMSHPPSDTNRSFVDHLTDLAASGKLRTEALSLLTRVGRSYPVHFSGGIPGGDNSDRSLSDHPKQGTGRWARVTRLLLRSFADSDQNLRLHALKVFEALLLARSEQMGHETENFSATEGTTPARGSASPTRAVNEARHVGCLLGMKPITVEGSSPSKESTTEKRGDKDPDIVVGVGAMGLNCELWDGLVQKHLQRALEDPYHGVRAVACSCHMSLLDADWTAFLDEERDRCLDRILAATRDRATGGSSSVARRVDSTRSDSSACLDFLELLMSLSPCIPR